MIGIVGGLGPWATADLLEKVAQETLAVTDQEHLPVVVMAEPATVPDRTGFLLGGGDGINPGDIVAGIVARLISAGATTIGIPCNTLHIPRLFGPIQEAARDARLVSIVDETITYITDHFDAGSAIGILGTAATIHFRLYTDRLVRSGYRPLTLDDQRTRALHDIAIFGEHGIKNTHGVVHVAARDLIASAATDLAGSGADALVFGCTELPAVLRPGVDITFPDVSLIDPTRLLARALIRECNPDKLRPEATA